MNKAIVIVYNGEEPSKSVLSNIGIALLPALHCSLGDIRYALYNEQDINNCLIRPVIEKMKSDVEENDKYNKDTLAAVYIAEKCMFSSYASDVDMIIKLVNLSQRDEKLKKAILLLGSPGNHYVDQKIANDYRMTEKFFKAVDKVYKLITE